MATKMPSGGSDRTYRTERKNGAVRFGVASRLFFAFCLVTLATVVVAVVGDSGLREARQTLKTSSDSFSNVSSLLENTTKSLNDTGATLTRVSETLDATVTTMEETSNRVNTLNTVELPAVIAIGAIREALTAVAVGERTLLMRQLYDADIRTEQRSAISQAFSRADAALESFARIEPRLGPEKRDAWQQFLASWKNWQAVHNQLMEQFDKIDDFLERRVRGGFEFEDVAKTAFDIAFGEGQTARDTVNRKLDAVVRLISDSTRESARVASSNTKNATDDAIDAKENMGSATRQLGGFMTQMDVVSREVRQTTEANAASIANAERARYFFIICSILGFLVSLILALHMTRYLSLPIRFAAEQMGLLAKGRIDRDIMGGYTGRSDEVGVLARSFEDMLQAQREEVNIAGEMASGDFSGSVRLRGDEDQLGKALSEMMRITHDALVRVNRHVQQVTEGSQAISTVSQSLSVGAIKTATALVQISASTTQIGEQTHRNAQNASRANDFAKSSRAVAERGYAAVEEMVVSMHEIQASSAKIAQIVKLIDDIAFQTNLLALNAAVEAARAGRQGKGFSVVADEVRNLAGRSAKAARETATLVEDTVKRVENGVAIAMRTDEAFKEILDNAQQTTKLYGEIAASSQEQSKNIDQIVEGLSQIDHSTQENSRYASQTANAAQALSRQSGELRQMMVRFQLQNGLEDGADAGRRGNDIEYSLPRRELPMFSGDVEEDDTRLLGHSFWAKGSEEQGGEPAGFPRSWE